jgi:hypothetical protein
VLLVLPPHHQNAQVKPEGDDDMQEHEYGGGSGAQAVTMMICKQHAIAIKMG